MNITMITPVFPPYAGGMGNVAFEYAEAAGKAMHTVTVLAPRYGTIKPRQSPHFETIPIEPIFTYGNAALIKTFDDLIPEDIDLVHIHYPCIGFVYALKKWHRTHPHIPILVTYHMDLVGSGWKGLFFKWYSKCALPMILSCVSTVHITSLDYARHSLLARYYTIENAKEIRLGVDTSFYSPTNIKNDFFSSFGVEPNEKILLFVGALDSAHTFKGVDVLLSAFALSDDNAKLVIIGTGNLKNTYERLARDLGISSKVIFTGFVEEKDLPQWYSRAYALVLPSTSSSEAFGKVLLEAQSCGTPVITSDLYGVRTVVDSNSGICVTPGDTSSLAVALSKMLFLNGEEYNAVSQSSRAFIHQNFDQKDTHNRLLDLYQNIVARARIHSDNTL